MKKPDLLQRLEAMRIEPADARLTFAARLASENGWSRSFADRVCAEYKRFLYLAATSDHHVTPSDAVDQAWHLHLTHTRHYWGVLCTQILERPLHHGPTAGGAAEDRRYRAQYEATLAFYTATFGQEPPRDIWPPTVQRFGTAYRRIVDGQHWMIRKKPVYAAVPMLALAACTAGGNAAPMAALLLVGVTVAVLMRELGTSAKTKRDNSSGCGSVSVGDCSSSDSGGSSGGSGCGGGCGGCGG